MESKTNTEIELIDDTSMRVDDHLSRYYIDNPNTECFLLSVARWSEWVHEGSTMCEPELLRIGAGRTIHGIPVFRGSRYLKGIHAIRS